MEYFEIKPNDHQTAIMNIHMRRINDILSGEKYILIGVNPVEGKANVDTVFVNIDSELAKRVIDFLHEEAHRPEIVMA